MKDIKSTVWVEPRWK